MIQPVARVRNQSKKKFKVQEITAGETRSITDFT